MVKGIAVVRCRGRIVFGEETAELHLYLRELLSANGRLVLDLRGVRYVDSSGMGLLIGIYVSAARDGALLKLVGMSTKVRRTLTISRLLTLFDVYEDEPAAIQACLA